MIFEIMRQIIRNKYSLFIYFNINKNSFIFFLKIKIVIYNQTLIVDRILLKHAELYYYPHYFTIPNHIILIVSHINHF